MEHNSSSEVTIIDIRMPFLSMVVFLVKAALAFIPALIILSIVSSILFALLGSVFMGFGMGPHY